MERMTNVKAIEFVLENAELPTDVAEKLEKMKLQFIKKSSSEKKPTANQKENEALKLAILDGMDSGRQYTITDLMKNISELADLSNQRVSAIVRQMKDEGTVVRTEEKRKAYFSKVEEIEPYEFENHEE